MKIFALCTILAAVFSMTACDWTPVEHQSFADYLQGTWVPNAESLVYQGTLKISFDRITITGFLPIRIYPYTDNPHRPFINFPRDVALSGFSEGATVNGHTTGHIFIEAGWLRPGISYRYFRVDQNAPFGSVHILHLYFNNHPTILERRVPY